MCVYLMTSYVSMLLMYFKQLEGNLRFCFIVCFNLLQTTALVLNVDNNNTTNNG